MAGVSLPSVTAILAACQLGPDFSRVPAAALEAARARGSAVHAAIEADHYGYDFVLPTEWILYKTAYDKFLVDTDHTPTLSEFRVESAKWRFCGHPDRIGWLSGKRALLDWKTAEALDLKPVSYQLAGYELAWNEQHPKEPIGLTAAVQLKRDGTYRLHVIETAPVLQVFQAAVIVVHARENIHVDERDRYLD